MGSPRLFVLLLLPLMAAASAPKPEQQQQQHCCLPVKWHSNVLKTGAKLLRYVRSNATQTELAPPLHLQLFVNHRRPRFQIRTPGGKSVLFWRGHMWLLQSDASLWPHLLNRVPAGYKPTGGYAPLFFRCLAPANGFVKLNDTLYRLVEPDDSKIGRKLHLKTVTDVHVVPTDPRADLPATIKGHRRHTCLLAGFSVSSTYARFSMQEGLIMVQDTDSYWAESPPRHGWPDRKLTERTRSFRPFYRGLLRSGGIQVNKPHLAVPVRTDGSKAMEREEEEEEEQEATMAAAARF